MNTSRQVDVKALVSHILRGDGSDKCRICMGDTTEGQVYLGDTVMLDGEKPVTLAELLETITGVEVLEEPSLPQGLCRTCSEDIVTAIHIGQLSKLSAQHWASATTYLSQIYDATDEDKCVYVFYNGEENTIVKDQIDRVPNVQEALWRLNGKLVFDSPKPRKIRRLNEVSCQCPICGKAFTNPCYLNKHLKSTPKRSCSECGLVVPKKNLSKHLSKAHDIVVYSCTRCNEVFEDDEYLMQHWLKSHGAKKFSCEDCGRSFVNERALSAHVYAHSLFHCKSCSLSFENRKCCKHHERQCNSEQQPISSAYECDHCGVSYKKKPSLKIHIVQKHMNVLPFVCTTCGKRTSTKAHLRSHEMTHKKVRKIYECYCGAKLLSELGYQLHQRIHSGEKPFACDECGDRFLSSSRRLDHIKRKHRGTNGLPYACEKCAARFVRPCELKRHYLVVHYSIVNVTPISRR